MLNEAFLESCKARYLAPPNPWVGCVVVDEGKIVGRGHTQPPGGPHAEVMALKEGCGDTVYVTLEPCCHQGRTGPCTEVLIKSKVKKVFIGILDPDPKVAGKGVEHLRAAGIEVVVANDETIKNDLAPYLHHRRTGRPFVVLKTASSIDGRVAAADGSSQWITCEEARADVHRQRDLAQAIVVGSGTALADNPQLNIRHVPQQSPRAPLRVVMDRRERITDPNAYVHRGDLLSLLEELGSRGILQLLVEGGPTLHSAFIEEGLVDRLQVYIGPKLLGSTGRPLATLSVTTLQEAPKLTLEGVTPLGNSARLDYTLNNTGPNL